MRCRSQLDCSALIASERSVVHELADEDWQKMQGKLTRYKSNSSLKSTSSLENNSPKALTGWSVYSTVGTITSWTDLSFSPPLSRDTYLQHRAKVPVRRWRGAPMVSASRLGPWYLTLGLAGHLYSVSDRGGTDGSLLPSSR